MSERLDRYNDLLTQSIAAQQRGDDAEDDRILEQLDRIWREMSNEEIDEARVYARVIAESMK